MPYFLQSTTLSVVTLPSASRFSLTGCRLFPFHLPALPSPAARRPLDTPSSSTSEAAARTIPAAAPQRWRARHKRRLERSCRVAAQSRTARSPQLASRQLPLPLRHSQSFRSAKKAQIRPHSDKRSTWHRRTPVRKTAPARQLPKRQPSFAAALSCRSRLAPQIPAVAPHRPPPCIAAQKLAAANPGFSSQKGVQDT